MKAPALRRHALEVAAGAGLTALALGLCSLMEWPWIGLLPVALVPWLLSLDRLPTRRTALFSGLVLSVLVTLVLFPWFPGAIADYGELPAWLPWFSLVLLAPLLFQPQFVPYALVRHVVMRAGAGQTDTVSWLVVRTLPAASWVAAEWLAPKIFADTLGHGLLGAVWLRQAADLGGAAGLTFLLLILNESLVRALPKDSGPAAEGRPLTRSLRLPVLLFLGLSLYGAWRIGQLTPAEEVRGVRFGLVQANLDHYDRMRRELGTWETVRRILDTHFGLSEQVRRRGGAEVIVWPETVYPTTFNRPKSEDGAAFDDEIRRYVTELRQPLVFGSYDADEGGEYNAAFFLGAPQGTGPPPTAIYRKAALFPLTEKVPWWLESAWLREKLPWLGTWKAGGGGDAVTLRLADGREIRVAPLICYDDIVPSLALQAVRQGAEILLVLSNDSWFATGGPGARLHLALSVFRSLETRRPQVRVTNTGLSVVVTPTGEIVERLRPGAVDTRVASVVPMKEGRTLLVRFGDWPGPVALCLGLLLSGVWRATRR